MRRRNIAFVLMALVVLACGATAWAQATIEDPFDAIGSGNALNGNLLSDDRPQTTVVCRGWHALCDFATDCKVVGDVANCACWKVNETYNIQTNKIQDPTVKYWTQAVCTSSTPCDVNQAPVCEAIRSGQFKVKGITYRWVSTFSYRGWCENWNPVPCDAGPWADCMSAPCTVIKNPTDPERPLNCQCRMKNSAFVGTRGSCEPGTVMSTIPQSAWNFDKNTYVAPFPGYEFVRGACAPLGSNNTTRQ